MSIDLEWEALPEGKYDAAIHEVEFRFGASTSMVIIWRALYRGREYFVDDWVTLDAPKTSSSYQRTAQGKGRIKQILAAYNEKMPVKIEPDDLVATLVGKSLRIVVTHKMVNGLSVPKVSNILGKAETPLGTP